MGNNGWVNVSDELPKCSKSPNSFGVEVLIFPPTSAGDRTAFYGMRIGKTPCFYRYGAPIKPYPTYWQPIPPPPSIKP